MRNFTLLSPEFKDLERLQLVHEFDGFDGTGQNRSPALQWHGAPEGTRSFALTLYDPDAPTGSGFWHWILFDIDSSVTQLAAGVGSTNATHLGASGTQAANDYGTTGYGARPRACPRTAISSPCMRCVCPSWNCRAACPTRWSAS